MTRLTGGHRCGEQDDRTRELEIASGPRADDGDVQAGFGVCCLGRRLSCTIENDAGTPRSLQDRDDAATQNLVVLQDAHA
jgi:hypothetical protein